jgi:hypothetical protein
MFTVNELGLPPSHMRCLTTTNIIENPNGIVRGSTRRVKRWRDQDMASRRTARPRPGQQLKRSCARNDAWLKPPSFKVPCIH